MGISEALGRLPSLGKYCVHFLLHPRVFVQDGSVSRIHVKEYVTWAIAISALTWSLYSIARGSPLERAQRAEQIFPQSTPVQPTSTETDARTGKDSKPEIEQIVFWRPGFGLKVTAESRKPSDPQRVLFELGMGQVVVKNVIISDLGESIITTFLLGIYSLAIVLCIHPAARLLRGKASLVSAIRLSVVLFFSSWVLVTVLVLCGCGLLLDAFRLSGWRFIGCWMALVTVPGFVVMTRCFFSSFSELYQISKKRLLAVGVFGAAASGVIFPFFFLPLLYVILRFHELWKALF